MFSVGDEARQRPGSDIVALFPGAHPGVDCPGRDFQFCWDVHSSQRAPECIRVPVANAHPVTVGVRDSDADDLVPENQITNGLFCAFGFQYLLQVVIRCAKLLCSLLTEPFCSVCVF